MTGVGLGEPDAGLAIDNVPDDHVANGNFAAVVNFANIIAAHRPRLRSGAGYSVRSAH